MARQTCVVHHFPKAGGRRGESMAHWTLSGGLLSVLTLLWCGAAHAEGVRCGDKLASTGASLYAVRAKCGDPDDAQHTVETRTVPQKVLVPCEQGAKLCETVVLQTVLITVDRWTYDFGNNRFIEFARFEQG